MYCVPPIVTTMNLKSIFVRLDEESLSKFLSKSAFRVLKEMDKNLVHLESLSNMVNNKVPKAMILRDSNMRNIIFNAMRKNEITPLLSNLGIEKYDNPVKHLKSVSFRKNSRNESILFDYFKIERPTEQAIEHEDISNAPEPEHALFDYQYHTMKLIEEHLDDKGRALLHMPTGAGKTRTAMRIVASYMLKHKSSFVIWLAYNSELCEQALYEFHKTWESMGDRSGVKTIRFFKNRNPDVLLETKKHKGIFLVAGLSKMYNSATQNPNFLAKLADRVDLVVIDEAHQAIATTYKFILEQLVTKNDRVRLLGLSATPGRTIDSQKLAEFFRYKKATISDNNPVRFLINNGYLSKPDTKPLKYDMKNLTAKESKELAKAYDIPDQILEKLADEEKRNLLIINTIEDLITEKHKRIIVFGATVKHAQDIAIILTARNHHAFYVTAETPTHIRKEILDDFLRNDTNTKILCNFSVLAMGFDAPKTSAVVIARPTKSLVLYSQMVGRATRGVNAGGTPKCSIRTVIDSALKDSINAPDVFLNWEDIWK